MAVCSASKPDKSINSPLLIDLWIFCGTGSPCLCVRRCVDVLCAPYLCRVCCLSRLHRRIFLGLEVLPRALQCRLCACGELELLECRLRFFRVAKWVLVLQESCKLEDEELKLEELDERVQLFFLLGRTTWVDRG